MLILTFILLRKRNMVALFSLRGVLGFPVLYVALPHGSVGWSSVCDLGIYGHTK